MISNLSWTSKKQDIQNSCLGATYPVWQPLHWQRIINSHMGHKQRDEMMKKLKLATKIPIHCSYMTFQKFWFGLIMSIPMNEQIELMRCFLVKIYGIASWENTEWSAERKLFLKKGDKNVEKNKKNRKSTKIGILKKWFSNELNRLKIPSSQKSVP